MSWYSRWREYRALRAGFIEQINGAKLRLPAVEAIYEGEKRRMVELKNLGVMIKDVTKEILSSKASDLEREQKNIKFYTQALEELERKYRDKGTP